MQDQNNSLGINTICFIGDYCLSGEDVGKEVLDRRIKPFSNLFELFGKNIKLIANIEFPFTNQIKGKPFKWANLKATPELSFLIDDLSIGILGNNHLGDFGYQGAFDTIKLLQEKGISYAGYGNNLEEAVKPAIIEIDGIRIGVVSLCCLTTNSEGIATHTNPGVAPIGMDIISKSVLSAKKTCELVVVYFHWGAEWVHDPVPDQLRLARHAIDCGAEAVVGCHSHTIQSYEQYKGRWIFYSLGNFLFKAGYGQKINKNGQIELVPLNNQASNRESIAVCFKIKKEQGEVGLMLDKIQPMHFDDNLTPRPISFSELTFDIEASNAFLNFYVSNNDLRLQDRNEPEYRALLRHGILKYYYMTDPINNIIAPDAVKKRNLLLLLFTKVTGITKAIILHLIIKIKRFIFYPFINWKHFIKHFMIKLKWFQDRRRLPLKNDHWELYFNIHRHYFSRLGYYPNITNCQNFNDKIQWLKLFDQDREMIRCSDKILVRDFVKERVGEKHLVELYQVHNHFAEINFDLLPQSFVIKTNHDSGTVILVQDKDKLDKIAAERRIEDALRMPYGWEKGEWAYAYIQPKVLVEKLIISSTKITPPDFKFYVVDGRVKFCHYIYDRFTEPKEQTIDRDGCDLKTELFPSFILGEEFVKPDNWEFMIEIAECLGRGFRCVRVDLYNTENRIYFGELTFWPLGGCYKGEGQKKLGKYLDFDLTNYKPFLLTQLNSENEILHKKTLI